MAQGVELQVAMPTTIMVRIMNKIINSMCTAIEHGFRMEEIMERPGSMAKPLPRIYDSIHRIQGSMVKMYGSMDNRVVRIGKMVADNMGSMS